MIQVYCDASYDRHTGLGAFCIVVDRGRDGRYWKAFEHLGGSSANDAEYAAVKKVVKLMAGEQQSVMIHTDSLDAIRSANLNGDLPEGFYIGHIKGHQLESMGGIVDEHTKCHHWADVMAGHHLDAMIKNSSVIY